MRKPHLRQFLAVIASMLMSVPITLTNAQITTPADTLLRNGRIYTANPKLPWVESLAIVNGTIVAAGSDAELEAYRGPKTQILELAGRMAMPGIIDSHVHFFLGSEKKARADLEGATSMEEIGKRIREFAAAHKDDSWVRGSGWVYGTFPTPDGLPTAKLLDELVPDRPAMIAAFDLHSYWVNSRALKAAGITRDTPDPKENGIVTGEIVRDPNTGEPSGVLKEAAMVPIRKVIPEESPEVRLSYLRSTLEEANRVGITAGVNASGSIREMELFEELARKGQLTVRMKTALGEAAGVKHHLTPAELEVFEEARRRFNSDWVRAGLIKFFADGIIENHSAGMIEPYANASTVRGENHYAQDEFTKLCIELDRRGFQLMTHAVGDGAVRSVLDAYEATIKANGARDRRFRIEHIEAVADSDIPRFAKLNTVASVQIINGVLVPEYPAWLESLGDKRWPSGLVWYGLAAAGAPLAFGSDWPVTSLNPFEGIQGGLTRQTLAGQPAAGWFPRQRLSLDQALAGYTRDAAHAAFFDDRIGTLQPGKLADVIVLSQNLFEVRPTEIAQTKVLLTMVGGKVVWRKDF